LEFLPFNTGKKYCSVLFVNENVGEFLYSIEGVANLPQPTSIPYNPNSPYAVRVSSAAASVKGKLIFMTFCGLLSLDKPISLMSKLS